MDGLETWAKDFETILRSVLESERSVSSIAYYVAYRISYANKDAADRITRCPKKDVTDLSDNNKIVLIPPDTPTPVGQNGVRRS
ncbi:hypothetical protein PG994_015205 [Apiospora phragmitis]|uniref:Uncharacterized protein n=1 Tax=Apiospora phragmitis TaxID=2905665 RepID=A0ABR1ST50_9PEZI